MILCTINEDILFYDEYSKHETVVPIYKQLKFKWLKALRRLHMRSRLPLYSLWYNKDFRCLRNRHNETYVIFDSIMTIRPANYLAKNTNNRVVYWFWNHIDNKAVLKHLKSHVERWSYDKKDCNNYNLIYNHQFNFRELFPQNSVETDSDLYFIGKNKGRSEILNQIKKCMEDLGLKFDIQMVEDDNSNRISYSDVINKDSRTRCVVDVVLEDQHGLTLRPLEALFLRKKLLTNCKDIVEYDFYSPDNVFIWGVDDMDKFMHFIGTPYNCCVDSYIKSYTFEDWVRNFSQSNK